MMKKEVFRFSLQALSAYRAELMGWSILWIMVMHFQFHWLTPVGFVSQYGFAGVEIFMFVSGFGLYFSLDKGVALLPYYRKRVWRIFPEYYFLGIVSSLVIYHDSLLSYLYRYSTIGYWVNNFYADWYIPALLSLYLVSPLVYSLFKRRRGLLFLAVVCVVLLVLSFVLVPREDVIDTPHFFLLYRIPAFVFGMACARWLKQGAGPRVFFLVLLVGIPLCLWMYPQHHVYSRFKIYSCFYLFPLFVYLFCVVTRMLGRWGYPLKLIGEASLEVYLIQNIFLQAKNRHLLPESPEWQDAQTILIVVVSCLAGILFHRLYKRVVR